MCCRLAAERLQTVAASPVEFRLLGSFEVRDNGGREVVLGPKQQSLLAILVLHRGEAVPADRLIEDLYGGSPPPSAAKSLRAHVSRLRKALGNGGLRTTPGGYVLEVEPESLDIDRMEALVREGRTALAAGDLATASETLRSALGLWRGSPLGEFRYADWAQPEAARLEEQRLVLLEDRFEADLALGHHAELVGELDALVHEFPLRERLRGHLMLALYRAGRQAEALEAYQAARHALVDELGIEPGRSLRELEQAVLRQDPALDLTDDAADDLEPAQRVQRAQETAPEVATVVRELRKTVTAVFVWLVATSSTRASLDPEALRRVTSRAFGEINGAVERHGGTIEAVTGDAITAVFGLPAVHEDDALRAVRAATEIRTDVKVLADELGDEGAQLEFRIGISTGEVVTGPEAGPQLRATGEPLGVSARLAQAAAAGEVVLDERTRRLVRDSVLVEAASTAAMSCFRLLEVREAPAAATSRVESPIVGRGRERRRLHDAFEQAVADQTCQLFTVLGAAGVGKSRLVREFVGEVTAEALVARGRCLPYGEGITYWPLIEAVKSAAVLDDTGDTEQSLQALAALLEGEEEAEGIVQRVAETIGLADAVGGSEESFSAVTAFFEALGRRQPVVLVFDDIQWGEATFLDLVEYLADWTRDAPILLVCLARPDLLDARPNWAGGKLNATTIHLESLSDAESAELVANLAVGSLDETTSRRIVEAAEGNPLFVEEMLALVREEGLEDAPFDVPPTIQALLAARLDRLSDEERTAIEAASVEGKVFHEGSVAVRVPESSRSTVHERLMALVRKELIRPDRGEFPGERGFRFRHLLIRDAAYESIPKEARAAFHERYAAWLERAAAERLAEYEEIMGYHLEQAFRYRSELGPVGDADRAIARRAAERLGAAGRRAFVRSDAPAAVNLLSRAVSLLPPDDPARVDLVPTVRITQGLGGDLDWAVEVLAEAIEAGGDRLRAHALVQQALLLLYTGPDVAAQDLIEIAQSAIGTFERLGDDLGLSRAWRLVGQAHYLARRAGDCVEAAERALVHARRAADRFEEREVAENGFGVPLVVGPTPGDAAARRCEQLLREAAGDPVLQANALGVLAYLHAIQGRATEAHELHAQGRQVMEALGSAVMPHSIYYATLVVWHDDAEEAERQLRPGYDLLRRVGEQSHLTSLATVLAQVLYARGRFDQAEEVAHAAISAARPHDVHCQTISRTVSAKVLARRGDVGRAEELAREAVAFVEPSDFLPVHAEALTDHAEILYLAGRPDEAAPALEKALVLQDQKGNVLGGARARALLEEIRS
jgi:DNA-binding SARP family transcriptional activator